MFDDNQKNSSCGFGEQMVSYLYGEAPETEKIRFQNHLKNCSECSGELEYYYSLRNSLSEWRKEFSELKVPTFVIPIEKAPFFVANASSTNEKHWLSANFGRLLSFNRQWATAFAVLAIFAGLFAIASRFSGNQEIAQSDLKNINQPLTSTIIEKKMPEPEDFLVKENSPDVPIRTQNSNINNPKPQDASSSIDATRGSVVKSSAVARVSAKGYRSSPNKNVNETVRQRKAYSQQALSSASLKNPKLVEIDDEQDDSVRLADLFDEVGGE